MGHKVRKAEDHVSTLDKSLKDKDENSEEYSNLPHSGSLNEKIQTVVMALKNANPEKSFYFLPCHKISKKSFIFFYEIEITKKCFYSLKTQIFVQSTLLTYPNPKINKFLLKNFLYLPKENNFSNQKNFL